MIASLKDCVIAAILFLATVYGHAATEILFVPASSSAGFTAAQFQSHKAEYKDILPISINVVGLAKRYPQMSSQELYKEAKFFADSTIKARQDTLVGAIGIAGMIPHPLAAPVSYIISSAVENPDKWVDRLMPQINSNRSNPYPESHLWSKVEQEASTNPRIKEALSAFYTERLKFSLTDSDEKVLYSVPEFRAQQDLEIFKQLKAGLIRIPGRGSKAVADVKQTVREVQKNWPSALDNANEIAKVKEAAPAGKREQLLEQAVNVKSAGTLLGFALSVAGDPQSAGRVVQAANGMSQILASAAQLGTSAGSGLAGAAGIAMGMSLFSSAFANEGPDPIATQFELTRQQLSAMQEELRSNVRILSFQLEQLAGLDEQILAETFMLSRDVQDLQRTIRTQSDLEKARYESLERSIPQQALTESFRKLRNCAEWRRAHGQISYQEFAVCVNLARDIGTDLMLKEGVIHPNARIETSGAYVASNPYVSIRLLVNEIANSTKDASWAKDINKLGNLQIWVMAADVFEQLLKDFPEHKKRFSHPAGEPAFRKQLREAIVATVDVIDRIRKEAAHETSAIGAILAAYGRTQTTLSSSLEIAFANSIEEALLRVISSPEPDKRQSFQTFSLCDQFAYSQTETMSRGPVELKGGDSGRACRPDGKCVVAGRAGPAGFGKSYWPGTAEISIPTDFAISIPAALLGRGGLTSDGGFRLEPLSICVPYYAGGPNDVIVRVAMYTGKQVFLTVNYKISNPPFTPPHHLSALIELLKSGAVLDAYKSLVRPKLLVETKIRAHAWEAVAMSIDQGKFNSALELLESQRGALAGSLQLAFPSIRSDERIWFLLQDNHAEGWPTEKWFKQLLRCTNPREGLDCTQFRPLIDELLRGPASALSPTISTKLERSRARMHAALKDSLERGK